MDDIYYAYCTGCGVKSVPLQLTDDEILELREGSYTLPLRDTLCVHCLWALDLEVDVLTGRAV